MHEGPRVAIITPVYNGAKFLHDAMTSVQEQSYANAVHVLLNNASTDATADIIATFANARIPVVVFDNPVTLPLAANWNRAVTLGRDGSDYFRILCADDMITDDGIEKMVALAETDPDIAVIASLRHTSTGIEEFGWDKRKPIFGGGEAIRACFWDGNGFATPHVMYRTAKTRLRPQFFVEDLTSFDTEAVFHVLSQNGAKLGFIHEPLGFTRRHSESITETTARPNHTAYFDWFTMMRQYGPVGLTADEYNQRASAFRRHYLRRLIAWRWPQSNKTAYNWHMEALATLGQRPGIADYADAFVDYALCKAGFRERWNRYPQG